MRRLGSFVAAAFVLGAVAAAPLKAWQWSAPLPHGDAVYAVSHCGGTYVAVGASGRAWSSSDALTWVEGTTGVAESLRGVACDTTRFVAVGDSGRIVETSDGANWAVASSPSTANLMHVARLGSTFVAAGEQGTLMTSPDGLDWTVRAFSPGSKSYYLGLAASGSTWLAAGGDWATDNNGLVSTSSDSGMTWTTPEVVTTTSAYGWFNGATAGSSGFALAHDLGSVVTSPTGTAPWTEHATGGPSCRAVAWDGSQYVATCYNEIRTSPTAETWTPAASGTQNYLYGLAVEGPAAVAVGDGRTIVAFEDGVGAWVVRESSVGPADLKLASVAWSANRYVAVGTQSSSVWTSPDGFHWTPSPRPADGFGASITGNGTLFLSVGGAGAWTSSDGATWSAFTVTGIPILRDATWDGSAWVAIASREPSRGLSELTPESAPSLSGKSLRSVACGDGTCVAVGSPGTLLTREVPSLCGTTWCLENTPVGYESVTFYAVTSHGGRFVAVGSGGAIVTRDVGSSTWTSRPTGVPDTYYSAGWVGDRFVAGGTRGVLFSSSDGQSWQPESSGTGKTISGACEGRPLLVGIDMVLSDSLLLHSEFETGDLDGWSSHSPAD